MYIFSGMNPMARNVEMVVIVTLLTTEFDNINHPSVNVYLKSKSPRHQKVSMLETDPPGHEAVRIMPMEMPSSMSKACAQPYISAGKAKNWHSRPITGPT
jgi:hypothetical protein